MYHYFNIIKDTPFTEDEINTAVNLSTIGLLEDETKYITFENVDGHHVLTVELHRQLEEVEADDLVEDLELVYNKQGLKDFVIEISNNDANEETYEGDDFFEAYSGGTETRPQINQDAVRIIKQLHDVDMNVTQSSKLVDELPEVDVVITM